MQQLLSFTQVVNLIKAVGDKRTVIVEGENGIGKTALFYALRNDPKFQDHIAVDPVDCTQLSDGSVWMPDIDKENGISRELPNERFGVNKHNQKGINGAKPALVFLDEIAKAPQFIKNVLAPIVYERRVGNYHMPEGSVVFCATNLSVEGLGDSIQAHLRNRLTFVKMRKPSADEWINWAADAGVAPEVIAFVHMFPQVMDSFMDYEDGGKYHGKALEKDNPYIFNPRASQIGYATPRSLVAASDIIKAMDQFDTETLNAALSGTVGESTAVDMSAAVRFGRSLPLFERIVKDPEGTEVPDNPTAQIVQTFQFVTRTTNRDEAEAVTKYVQRMRNEMQSLFVNTVARSTRIAQFATVPTFGKMLADNKKYH